MSIAAANVSMDNNAELPITQETGDLCKPDIK